MILGLDEITVEEELHVRDPVLGQYEGIEISVDVIAIEIARVRAVRGRASHDVVVGVARCWSGFWLWLWLGGRRRVRRFATGSDHHNFRDVLGRPGVVALHLYSNKACIGIVDVVVLKAVCLST